MYYYKARMYNAKLGRFLQTDPIGYQDGMNWYGYTSGDPVNRRDPTGLSSTTCSNDPGVCQPPIEEVHVYGTMSGSSWSCEGWVCQDYLRDIFRTQDGAQASSDNQSWFSGNGVDDSDIRWSAGFQGGAKLGIKGLLGGAVELKAPVIETSLVTGNRYASEGYGLVIDVGKWSFGYEAKRSIQVGNRDIMAGYLLRGIPYEGGFKFGSYGISSSEFGVFSIGVTAIGSIEATFDFVDGTK